MERKRRKVSGIHCSRVFENEDEFLGSEKCEENINYRRERANWERNWTSYYEIAFLSNFIGLVAFSETLGVLSSEHKLRPVPFRSKTWPSIYFLAVICLIGLTEHL
jgi:predicted nucleic acid-binding Zn ribbon protein